MATAVLQGTQRGFWLPTGVRYFPIIFFELFFLFTLITFAFGPWVWPIRNPGLLYSFLIVNQVALVLGYVQAVHRETPASFRLPIAPEELAWLSALITVALLVPTAISQTGGIINFAQALTDPGQAYKASRYAVSVASPTIVGYIRMLLSPLIWPLMPLAVVFWNRLHLPLKGLALTGIIGGALIFFLIGTNKGIVDILLLLPWLLIIRSEDPAAILRPKRVMVFVASIVMALAVFVPYFGANIVGRGNTGSVDDIVIRGDAPIRPEALHISGIDLPSEGTYALGATILASYIGQGYYGLSLALEEPFIWTYGVGHSRILTWLAEKTEGSADVIKDMTYPSRIDHDFGWNVDTRWSSFYPWFASDVSFFGVPVIVFFFGRLLGLTWLDSMGKNPVAVVLFCLTCLTVFYMSANAQIFQASDTVFVFYFYLLWWIKSRIKAVWQINARV